MNQPEIWMIITVEEIEPGDYVRVTERYEAAKNIYEGKVSKTSGEGDQILIHIPISGGGGELLAWGRSRPQDHGRQVAIERRKPAFNFPTRPGSALLVYDVDFLSDRVLVLDTTGRWLAQTTVGDGLIPWDQNRILTSKPRALWDAASA